MDEHYVCANLEVQREHPGITLDPEKRGTSIPTPGPVPWPILKHIPHGSSERIWEMKPPLPPAMSSSIPGQAGSLSFSVSLFLAPFPVDLDQCPK